MTSTRNPPGSDEAALDPSLERRRLELKGRQLITEVVSLRVGSEATALPG